MDNNKRTSQTARFVVVDSEHNTKAFSHHYLRVKNHVGESDKLYLVETRISEIDRDTFESIDEVDNQDNFGLVGISMMEDLEL